MAMVWVKHHSVHQQAGCLVWGTGFAFPCRTRDNHGKGYGYCPAEPRYPEHVQVLIMQWT